MCVHFLMPPLKLVAHGGNEKTTPPLEVLNIDIIVFMFFFGGIPSGFDRGRG